VSGKFCDAAMFAVGEKKVGWFLKQRGFSALTFARDFFPVFPSKKLNDFDV